MAGGEEVEGMLEVAHQAVDLGPQGAEPADEDGEMGGKEAVEREQDGGKLTRELGPGVAGGRGLDRGMGGRWVHFSFYNWA